MKSTNTENKQYTHNHPDEWYITEHWFEAKCLGRIHRVQSLKPTGCLNQFTVKVRAQKLINTLPRKEIKTINLVCHYQNESLHLQKSHQQNG